MTVDDAHVCVTRVERRRTWTAEEKAELLAAIDGEGGGVAVVARRYRIPPVVLYNWRSARKAAASAKGGPEAVEFVPLGVFNGAAGTTLALLPGPDVPLPPQPLSRRGRSGAIEITLPRGARICVDAFVHETALARVLRAMKRST